MHEKLFLNESEEGGNRMTRKIRVAIIGCGSIAVHRHAPEYANNPNVELVKYYDPSQDRAERLASRYGGAVASELAEIIRDPSIDAVSVCTSNETHRAITVDALRHGKHVLCEKPIALSLEEAREMIQAQKESGKILMLDHNQRFLSTHIRAKELIRKGEIGRILSFKTTFGHKGPEYWSVTRNTTSWFFQKDRSGFGVEGDLGIHKFDLIRFLLEEDVAEVSAFRGTLDKKYPDGSPVNVSDNMVAILRMKSGVLGTATFSWTYYGNEENGTILYGDEGVMRIYEDPVYSIRIEKRNGERTDYKVDAIQTNDNQTKSGVIDAFVESVLSGTPSPVTGEDGLKALQIVLAAIESADTGRHVVL